MWVEDKEGLYRLSRRTWMMVKKLNLYRYARVQDKPPYELDSRQYSVSLNHARNTSKCRVEPLKTVS